MNTNPLVVRYASVVRSARAKIALIKSLDGLGKYENRMTRLYECGALSAGEFGAIIGLIADREVEMDLAA